MTDLTPPIPDLEPTRTRVRALAERARALGSADPALRALLGELDGVLEEMTRQADLLDTRSRADTRLYEDARRASEAKSEFVASMSHEFRTPLTGILAYADLIVAGIPEPAPPAPRRHAERILAAARHLGELIDQVLTFSRLEANRARVVAVPVDLASFVRETAELIEPLARQKGLGFDVAAPESGPVLRTDPNKLRQVLFNLLGNAVKFTEAGEVRLTVREMGEYVVIEVADTGEGIPPEHIARIWEPFWQAGRPAAGRPAGTGLGLGIVRGLVRAMGGEVRVRSETGAGSVFTVELRDLEQDA